MASLQEKVTHGGNALEVKDREAAAERRRLQLELE